MPRHNDDEEVTPEQQRTIERGAKRLDDRALETELQRLNKMPTRTQYEERTRDVLQNTQSRRRAGFEKYDPDA